MDRIFITPPFLLVFPALFKPIHPYIDQGATPKFRLGMAFHEGANLEEMKNLAAAVSEARFKKRYALRSKSLQLSNGGYQIYFAQTMRTPLLRCIKEDGLFEPREEKDIPVGSLCVAEITFFPYEVQGIKGVGIRFGAVTKLEDPKFTPVQLESIGIDIFERGE